MQWYLMLLNVQQDMISLPRYPDGFMIFLRGHYIIMAQRDAEGNLINCKLQSDRIIPLTDALVAFENELQKSGMGGV